MVDRGFAVLPLLGTVLPPARRFRLRSADDAVDTIAERVLLTGGDLVTVPADRLPGRDRFAAILRCRA